MVKNAKTAKGLEKALDIIDREVTKRTERKLVHKVINVIRKEKKRLKGLRGKKKTKIETLYNNRLAEYIDKLTYASEDKIESLKNGSNRLYFKTIPKR